MSPGVSAAVGLFCRRIGESVVFDRDDARQEAEIGMWLAGPTATSTVGYRRIVDALRRLIPGYRARQQAPVYATDEVPDFADEETPEDIASQRDLHARVQQMPLPARQLAEIILAGGTMKEATSILGITSSAAAGQLRVACQWLEAANADKRAPAHHMQPITK